MAISKKVIRSVFLVLLLAGAGTVLFFLLRTRQDNRLVIPLDGENSLIVTRLSSRIKDTRTFIGRSHIEKGLLWKRPFDNYESEYLYEPRYRRDVMLKDGKVSFYSESENLLYLFNYEDGSVAQTMELPRTEDPSLYWNALQDEDSLYLLSSGESGELLLKALDFPGLSLRWETSLGSPERISDNPYRPLQNEGWIALHTDSYNGKEVLVIDKKDGGSLSFMADEAGFLLDNFYYYLAAGGGGRTFVRQNLLSGIREPLFAFEDSFPSPGDERWPFLWLYNNRLVHLSGDERSSSVKLRNLEDGSIEGEITLPEGYLNIIPSLSQISSCAPEFSGFPYIQTAFLPLLLGESGASGFAGDNIRLKIAVIDLEGRRLQWESRPVYVPSTFMLFNVNETNFYDDGIYGIFIPLPQRRDTTYEPLLLINGNEGKVSGCLRIKEDGSLLSDYSLSRTVRRSGDGCLAGLSDRAFFLPDMRIEGKDERRYSIEDLRGLMGDIYGF